MFCGLCFMCPQPAAASPSQAPSGPDPGHKFQAALQQGVCRTAPLLWHESFAGFQGWALELEGLVPATPSRGEKASVRAGKCVPCRAGSGTKASCHAVLGLQIQWGQREATEQLQTDVWLVLQGQHKPQHQNSAQSCSGPLGEGAGGLTCPTAAAPSHLLPCNHTASISHPNSRGRSRAKGPQSLAPHISNCWWSWGRDTKHPAPSLHGPFPVPCTTVLPGTSSPTGQMGDKLQLLLRALPAF